MRRRPSLVAIALVWVFVLPAAVMAQEVAEAVDVTGHWSGEIEIPGSPLKLNIDFVDADGVLSGDVSIPVQAISDMALAGISVDGDAVSFMIPDIPGEPTFNGTVDGDSISGEFTQGGASFPFSLSRGEPIAEIAREALEGIDPVIEQALEDFGIPGLAIAVVADDQVVMAKGYGMRDVEGELPVTPETLFAIGSTTKAFTAFVIGTLVDEGKLDWDTPLIEYMPDFRMNDPHATRRLKVRDLVIHSSGLPRHDLLWYNSSLSREELFARLEHLEPTRDLGEEFQYQNLMFMTAGLLAERVTGQSWEDLVRERVFSPLEMSRSNFSVETSQQDPDHALPYGLDQRAAERIPFRNIDTVGPAGSINSSVSEMTQWMRLQLGGGEIGGERLIEQSTLREMHTPQMAISSYPSNQRTLTLGYGMAWAIESHRGHFLVQHGGGIDGFISWVALLPMENFGVVVYTNGSGFNPLPTAVARTAIDRILGLDDAGYLDEALKAAERAEEAVAEAEENAESRRKEGTSPSHDLAEYAGKYEHPGYGIVEVTQVEGGDAALRAVYNSMPLALEHWHFDTFSALEEGSEQGFDGTKILFRLDTDGEVAALESSLEPNVDAIVFEKLADEKFSRPEYLSQFVGEYELREQGVTVSLHGEELRVSLPGQPTYTLSPLREAEFAIGDLNGFSMVFVVDEDGNVTAAQFVQPNGIFEATRVRQEE